MANVCNGCQSPKAKIDKNCELCGEPSCKKCLHFLDENSFPFWDQKSKEISKSFYCTPCFENTVTPEVERYRELMDQARAVNVIPKDYRGKVKVIKKALKEIEVKNCVDRDETLLRLAFKAVELGFNALMQSELKCTKVRKGAYQTSSWGGHAFPATIIETVLRDEDADC